MEEIFDSVGKIRILNLLAVEGELNVTAITDNTGLNHVRVNEHLQELKEYNIIQEKRFGRIKIFSLNSTNDAADKIKFFFEDWHRDANQNVRLERQGL